VNLYNVDEFAFARLHRRYRALARAYLELGHSLKHLNADLTALRAELRSAQQELARLRAVDRAQRAERDEAAPLQ